MIFEAEIRRLAAVAQIDPMVLDLDYSLGWFLAGLASIPDVSNRLVFKGGTLPIRSFLWWFLRIGSQSGIDIWRETQKAQDFQLKI